MNNNNNTPTEVDFEQNTNPDQNNDTPLTNHPDSPKPPVFTTSYTNDSEAPTEGNSKLTSEEETGAASSNKRMNELQNQYSTLLNNSSSYYYDEN